MLANRKSQNLNGRAFHAVPSLPLRIDRWQRRQFHIFGRAMGILACEPLIFGREVVRESALRQEELPLFHTHEPVQAVGFSSGIVGEFGLGQLNPVAIAGSYPLVVVQGFAQSISVSACKVLTKAIQSAQVLPLFGAFQLEINIHLFVSGRK